MDQITLQDKLYYLLMLSIVLPFGLFSIGYTKGVSLLKNRGMVRKNYEGISIPTAGGLLLFVVFSLTWLVVIGFMQMMELYPGYVRPVILFWVGSVAVLLFGWQDDSAHDSRHKGFRGHLHTLLIEHRMTSGLLKAFGIFGVSLVISIPLSAGFIETILNSLILSLSSNVINMFDLQPTRAIKVFWCVLILVFATSPIVNSAIAWAFILPVLSGTLWFFFRDASGVIMLGDTGSNYLGFILGFMMLSTLTTPVKLIVVCLFIILHVLAEKISFSQAIQSRAWLSWLDSLGRNT